MLKYLLISLALSLLVTEYCKTQDEIKPGKSGSYILTKLYDLPDELSETSGIILYDSLLWTFNDSGGEAVIYALNPVSGKIVKSVKIDNGSNKDWEDIAQNSEYIFIGDFGNNDGSRKDLCIYMIEKKKISKDPVQKINAGIISFVYSNQEDFTAALYANPFDCEAMIADRDSIYLFTKDWLNLKTCMYSLPIAEGKVTANHINNFDSDGLVTGADLNVENNNVVFCGYNLFYPFIIVVENIRSFLPLFAFELEELSGVQIEGVAYAGKNRFFLTNEKSSISQALQELTLNND